MKYGCGRVLVDQIP